MSEASLADLLSSASFCDGTVSDSESTTSSSPSIDHSPSQHSSGKVHQSTTTQSLNFDRTTESTESTAEAESHQQHQPYSCLMCGYGTEQLELIVAHVRACCLFEGTSASIGVEELCLVSDWIVVQTDAVCEYTECQTAENE